MSVAPSTLEANVLRVADVAPAMVLQGTVLKLEPSGAEVSLGEVRARARIICFALCVSPQTRLHALATTQNVRGFIATQHLGDAAKRSSSKALLAKRAQQFKVGARVSCRALVVRSAPLIVCRRRART